MFRAVCAASLGTFLLAGCDSQANPSDWQKARWGMNLKEVVSAFDGHVVLRTSGSIQSTTSNNSWVPDPEVKAFMHFDLSGWPATAMLFFDKNGLLYKIAVLDNSWAKRSYINNVKDGLFGKYGRSISEEKTDKAEYFSEKIRWRTERTGVEFSSHEYDHDGEVGYEIDYFKAVASDAL